MFWDEKMVTRLDVLASRRLPGSWIAETINHEFGTTLTESAVSSKA